MSIFHHFYYQGHKVSLSGIVYDSLPRPPSVLQPLVRIRMNYFAVFEFLPTRVGEAAGSGLGWNHHLGCCSAQMSVCR